MLTPFKRTLSAAGLSLGLGLAAVTSSASPAAADNDNLRNFLGAAGALLIIGAIVENNRSTHRPAPVTRHVAPQRPSHYRFVAPSRCYGHFFGPSVNLRAFGADCMQHHARNNDYLPRSCRERIHTYQGWREVYDAQCLYRHGWVRS